MDSFGGFGEAVVCDTNCVHAPPPQNGTHDDARNAPHQGGESWPVAERFLGLSNEELGRVDPVVMNLAVAKGVPSLAGLDIGHYVQLADEFTAQIRGYLPGCEASFYRNPDRWGRMISTSAGSRHHRLVRPQDSSDRLSQGPEESETYSLHRPDRPVPERRHGYAAGDLRKHGAAVGRAGAAAGVARVAGLRRERTSFAGTTTAEKSSTSRRRS